MVPTREVERRYTPGTVEFRDAQAELPPVFHGYALKFGKLSQNLGGFVENVANRSTIAKTLADGGDVVARIHHKDEYLLGRTSSRTLRLNPDDIGLAYDVDRPDTTYARDLEALARRGDIRHSSFAFRTIDDDWGLTKSGFPVRTLLEVQLVDVAPVVNPAYLDTSSSVRSLAGRLDASPDEVAELLSSGRLRDALKPGATHIDLGERKFDPRQPRANDGKWSDGPGGGGGLSDLLGDDDEDEEVEVFRAATTARAGTGKVGIAPREDGGVDLGLKFTDDPITAVVSLSEEDVADLGVHLDWVEGALKDRQKLADEWEDEQSNSPEVQAKEARRDELTAAMKKELAATGLPKGHPKRVAIQKKYDAQIDVEVGDQVWNPFEDGSALPESVATFGNLHFSANLTDTDSRIVLSDKRITDDTSDDTALVMSPRQAKSLLAKIKSTADSYRSAPNAPEISEPDALHSLSVRARHLELMRRTPL